MASRAHVIHDYSLASAATRPRRPVHFRSDDAVVLPRSSWWSTGGGVITTALAVGALVVGGVYAVSYRQPPTLSETEAAPLEDNYEPSPDFMNANAINALNRPLYAVRDLAAPGGEVDFVPGGDVPSTPSLGPHEVVIDDSAPGVEDTFPQTPPDLLRPAPPPDATPDPNMTPPNMTPDPNMTRAAPYPNPSTTPPDAIAPERTAPSTPTPVLDPENPYR